MTEQNDQQEPKKKFYSPSETAAKLGVTVDRLRQMRWQGRIKGTDVGNSTVYTDEDIAKAELTPRRRGAKKKRKPTEQEEEQEFALAV